MKTHYEVTVITEQSTTRMPFPTAKLAAFAALLACRSTGAAADSAIDLIPHFTLGRRASRATWSNGTRTHHVEVVAVRAISAPIAERMAG